MTFLFFSIPFLEEYTINKYIYSGIILFPALAGCVGPTETIECIPRPLGQEIHAFHASSDDAKTPDPVGAFKHQETMTLNQALVLALMHNPELEAFSYHVRASEARMLQARLLQNPYLAAQVESLGRDSGGTDLTESYIALGQVIELGGKRKKRMRVAAASGELAGWDYESKRLDVFTLTAQRFIGVLASQRNLELAKSYVLLLEQSSHAVSERVEAGKETSVQATKARAALEMARLDVMEAESNLSAARKVLAASWGADQPLFTTASGDFESIHETLPSENRLRQQLPFNPDIAREGAELELREAVLASKKASGVPDVTAMVGLQHFNEDDSEALMFGIGVPLPLFNRNQGNIAASSFELEKVRAERKAIVTELMAELSRAYAHLTSAQRKTLTLQGKVIPAMEGAFEITLEGYNEGKYGFLDVLDAQRSLFATQGELIDSTSEYFIALSEIERITGTSVGELLENKTEVIK